MHLHTLMVSLLVLLTATGCAPTVSSTLKEDAKEPFTEEVKVSQQALPPRVDYEVIGTVKANSSTGYSGPEALYPLIADEARKIGANAVMSAQGGRSPSTWSWAAPFVEGTAVWVEDKDDLKELDGEYY